MKLMKSLAIAATALWGAGAASAEDFKMSVTTSFANSGLAEVLLPEILADTGLNVQLLVVGTGQALALGAAGDVDAVLVHSRAAEDKWLAEGNGTHRREIMYNDFILIGPSGDPAGIKGAETAAGALKLVADAQAAFVSRGDDSGTHKAELALWKAAGVDPAGDWYRSVGQGMGAALNTAAGMDAYILADRASWLNFGNKADLALLFAGDPKMFNQYAYLPVNPEKFPHVKAEAAARLEAWLTSDKAKGLIEGYKIEGEQLFVFNAVAN
ncbi:MAG: substrate-binding domain-containing protein [Paracoccaceae bacterium]|nr:substrate-binding domain-containing protein [Paracoccaceae bacterium]